MHKKQSGGENKPTEKENRLLITYIKKRKL